MDRVTWRSAQIAIGVVGVAVMTVTAAAAPDLRYPSLFFMLLGLLLTWRLYRRPAL